MDSIIDFKACPLQYVLHINDTLNIINGKWKLPIIGSVLFGKKRFTEMLLLGALLDHELRLINGTPNQVINADLQ